MDGYLAEYMPILIFLAIAIALAVIIIVASLLVGPPAPGSREAVVLRMRLRAVRGRPRPVRRAVLPGRHPVHHLRPRGGVPVPVGGEPRQHRPVRLLVDDGVPGRADGRLRLRVAQGSPGMGVTARPDRCAAPACSTRSHGGLEQQGFFVTKLNDLVSWAALGLDVADDLRARLLRRRDDARGGVAL